MFQLRNKVEDFTLPKDLGDWESNSQYDVGPVLESLGRRLDAAREARDRATNEWQKWYWTLIVDNLTHKWKKIVRDQELGNCKPGMHMPEYTVTWNWFEPEADGWFGWSLPWLDNWLYARQNQERLTASWERARRNDLQKARQGLL